MSALPRRGLDDVRFCGVFLNRQTLPKNDVLDVVDGVDDWRVNRNPEMLPRARGEEMRDDIAGGDGFSCAFEVVGFWPPVGIKRDTAILRALRIEAVNLMHLDFRNVRVLVERQKRIERAVAER